MKKILVLCISLSSCVNLEHQKKNVFYLDYAASWELNKASLIEFVKVSRLMGNSSGINPHAKHLKALEQKAAKIIASKIGVNPNQIHFTAGASFANNIAILGVALKNPGCHLITSQIEHKSVLNVFKHLEALGYKVTYLKVDKNGHVDLDQLEQSITSNTKLISIQVFNSEIGILQDISRIGEIAHRHNVLFHTDASQSFCKYDIDMKNLDLVTISGHKIGAPKGIGAIYVRDISKLQPIMFGSGDQLWPGTKPTAMICAFAKAVEIFKFNKKRIVQNYNALINELSKINNIYINSATPSHIISVSIDGVLLKDVLEGMNGYSFSAGCSCIGNDKSNVIEAIDPDNKLPGCTLRISFSDKIKEKTLIDFAKNLKKIVEKLRKEKKIKKNCESTLNSNKLIDSLEKIKALNHL